MDLSIPLCVLSFLLLLGYNSCQEIILNPDDEIVEKNIDEGGFTVSCEAEGETLASAGIEWLDPDNKPIGYYESTGKRNRMYLLDIGNKRQLMFESLKNGDEGTYTCRGMVNGVEKTKEFLLKLQKNIEMHSSRFQQPKIYTDAFIECNVTATPSPTVVWRWANRSMIELQGRYSVFKLSLKIKNITTADNGIYVCMAESSGKTRTYEIKVQVTVPPKMKGPPVFSEPIIGQKFEMSCEADGTPPPDFKFKKGGVVLEGDRYQVSVDHETFLNRGTLVIDPLEDNDEGDYVCSAFNKGGSDEQTVFVDTIVPPQIDVIQNQTAAEGSAVELLCVARADPKADVQWHITGTDIALQNDPEMGISLEEAAEEQPLIHVVTKKLKFSNLKPANTNNYTCTASNGAGMDSKTGTVIVQFKPNFDNTPYSATYGWANHATEIKCIADGVPLPSISWQHNGNKIKEGGNFNMAQESGTRQLIGTLSVGVNIENVGTIFGTYTCVAVNMHGESTHDIELKKAEIPKAPAVTIDGATPTTMDILITPPSNNGGQPVIDYKIVYHKKGDPSKKTTKKADVSSDPNEPRTQYRLEELKPVSFYIITVAARNQVGYGENVTVEDKTPAVRTPGVPKIISPAESDNANSYTLLWETPLTGGSPLTGFKVAYTQVEVSSKDGILKVERTIGQMETISAGQDAKSVTLKQLEPSTYYEVQLMAVNSIGESMASSQIFKTAPGGRPVSNDQPAMATGAIIGILIAVIIILFIVIDVTFYFTKQCGLLWTLKGKVAGGDGSGERADAEATDHEKEAFIKDGKQDSEEPSAKENVDMVNETDKADEDLKDKELEPEDKEEKVPTEPSTEPAPEQAEEAKEAAPPAASPQAESAGPEPSTEPAPGDAAPDVPEKDPKV